MKAVKIDDVVWYKIRSDDIRMSKVVSYAPNVNGKEMFKLAGCDFWFTKEQLSSSKEDLIKKEK